VADAPPITALPEAIMFARVHKKKSEVSDINLIPVMNLFVTLIPFLLLGAAFVHVGVIPASLPTTEEKSSAASEDDVDNEPTSVTIKLQFRAGELSILADNPEVEPEKLAALSATIPLPAEGPLGESLETMTGALHRVKQAYPDSDTMILMPERTIAYQRLVQVLDAAREIELEGGNKTPLFPVVVLSELAEASP